MRKRKLKVRCTKQVFTKCKDIVRTYDEVQLAYAKAIQQDPDIESFECNVLIEDQSIGEFTSDFILHKADGELAVRECCYRSQLLKPPMIKLLDFSQRYWRKKGISDWKVVVEKEDDHAKE